MDLTVNGELKKFAQHCPVWEINGDAKQMRCRNGCKVPQRSIPAWSTITYLLRQKCPKCYAGMRPQITLEDEEYAENFTKQEELKKFAEEAGAVVVLGDSTKSSVAQLVLS